MMVWVCRTEIFDLKYDFPTNGKSRQSWSILTRYSNVQEFFRGQVMVPYLLIPSIARGASHPSNGMPALQPGPKRDH